MSVSLTPINDEEGDSFDCSNHTWHEMTADVEGVPPWNGLHDPFVYTPDQLRAIGAKHPQYREVFEWLASAGGAELS